MEDLDLTSPTVVGDAAGDTTSRTEAISIEFERVLKAAREHGDYLKTKLEVLQEEKREAEERARQTRIQLHDARAEKKRIEEHLQRVVSFKQGHYDDLVKSIFAKPRQEMEKQTKKLHRRSAQLTVVVTLIATITSLGVSYWVSGLSRPDSVKELTGQLLQIQSELKQLRTEAAEDYIANDRSFRRLSSKIDDHLASFKQQQSPSQEVDLQKASISTGSRSAQ